MQQQQSSTSFSSSSSNFSTQQQQQQQVKSILKPPKQLTHGEEIQQESLKSTIQSAITDIEQNMDRTDFADKENVAPSSAQQDQQEMLRQQQEQEMLRQQQEQEMLRQQEQELLRQQQEEQLRLQQEQMQQQNTVRFIFAEHDLSLSTFGILSSWAKFLVSSLSIQVSTYMSYVRKSYKLVSQH